MTAKICVTVVCLLITLRAMLLYVYHGIVEGGDDDQTISLYCVHESYDLAMKRYWSVFSSLPPILLR